MTVFHGILIGLGFGMFLGWAIKDLLTTDSKITYHIKRLRAKEGSTITVEAEAVQNKKDERKQRRRSRKNK